jgi:type IV secretion system protein VirB11
MAKQTAPPQIQEMLYEAFGVDIIKWLYFDDGVIEIEKNPDGEIWIDRLGQGQVYTGVKMDDAAALRIINIVSAMKDTSCDESNPTVSASIPGTGERFEGIVPPASEVPCFTIRKHAIKNLSLDDYVAAGTMTLRQKESIVQAVKDKENIMISGSTSSGKTTLTNAIIAAVAEITDDRLFVIEDTKELRITAENCVRTYITDTATGQRLLKSAMRMNPTRIVVGEVRDALALDLIMAWNTGHPGGVATVHANSALDALYRIEELIGVAGKKPEPKLISRAVNFLIHIEGGAKGRKIKEIARVRGYNRHEDMYELDFIEQHT